MPGQRQVGKSIADELGNIEEQVFSLLNSKDESGNYLFSGSKTDVAPYVRNNDGTYTTNEVSYLDDYNNKDKSRNLWLSLNVNF